MYKAPLKLIYFYFLLKKGIWYVISMLFYLCYLFYIEATFYFGTSMTISDPPALSRWRPSWLRDAGRGHHVLALWRRQWSEKCDILLWRPFCLTSKLWKNGISSIIMYYRKIFTTHKQKTKVELCFNETLALLFGIVCFFFSTFHGLARRRKQQHPRPWRSWMDCCSLSSKIWEKSSQLVSSICVLDVFSYPAGFFWVISDEDFSFACGLFRKEGGDFLWTSKRCM